MEGNYALLICTSDKFDFVAQETTVHGILCPI